ncbi:MAG: hypothetical protein U0L10_00365, partial [Lachnospiraceae bacterium]|nr:hypothetical protein [Lachnospiraceae bacterium]
ILPSLKLVFYISSVTSQSFLKLNLPDRRRSREAEEGVDVTPSATDDNDAGGDEMVILILIMIEMAH